MSVGTGGHRGSGTDGQAQMVRHRWSGTDVHMVTDGQAQMVRHRWSGTDVHMVTDGQAQMVRHRCAYGEGKGDPRSAHLVQHAHTQHAHARTAARGLCGKGVGRAHGLVTLTLQRAHKSKL